MNLYSSFIHNLKSLETTQTFLNHQMGKQIVAHLTMEYYPAIEKEQGIDRHNMKEFQMHCAKRKKPDPKTTYCIIPFTDLPSSKGKTARL